jgi:hypothetical protein
MLRRVREKRLLQRFSCNNCPKSRNIQGALFYYYKNKKGLYLYLIEHTRNMLEENIRREINFLKEQSNNGR